MSARPWIAPPSNRFCIGLLIAAQVCFVAFHLLPIYTDARGWELVERFVVLLTSRPLPSGRFMIASSSFLMVAILVTVSPFVTSLLRASRPCHLLAVGASGAALLGFGSLILDDFPNYPALWVLLAAMILNFIGLICLPAPRLEPGPDAP